MRDSDKFCLKWNDFRENISSALGSMREDTDFSDLTLVCEDGQQVEVHKVILAASSQFFQSILRGKKHSHAFIYMRGVNFDDLVVILNYIYHGEAYIHEENLDSFLALAEELKLKGLATSVKKTKKEETHKQILQKINFVKTDISKQSFNNEVKLSADEVTYFDATENITLDGKKIIADLQDLDEKIESMMQISKNFLTGSHVKRNTAVCTACGKEGQYANIKTHIETNHIEGIIHTCHLCNKAFKSRKSLNMHGSYNHNQ